MAGVLVIVMLLFAVSVTAWLAVVLRAMHRSPVMVRWALVAICISVVTIGTIPAALELHPPTPLLVAWQVSAVTSTVLLAAWLTADALRRSRHRRRHVDRAFAAAYDQRVADPWAVAAATTGILAIVVTSIIVGLPHPGRQSHCCTAWPPPPRPSQQDLYSAALQRDLRSLDEGVLTYSPIRNLATAATASFKVVVTDIGRSPRQTSRLVTYNGMTVYQQDVPTRGIVGVAMAGCENLICLSLSSARQPVLTRGHAATWYWQISAGAPGTAMIILRVDTYDQGSDQTLREEIVQIDLTVLPTTAYMRQQNHAKIAHVTTSIVGDLQTIGSIAGAFLAVAGVAGLAVKRRQRKRVTDDTAAVATSRTNSARYRSVVAAGRRLPTRHRSR